MDGIALRIRRFPAFLPASLLVIYAGYGRFATHDSRMVVTSRMTAARRPSTPPTPCDAPTACSLSASRSRLRPHGTMVSVCVRDALGDAVVAVNGGRSSMFPVGRDWHCPWRVVASRRCSDAVTMYRFVGHVCFSLTHPHVSLSMIQVVFVPSPSQPYPQSQTSPLINVVSCNISISTSIPLFQAPCLSLLSLAHLALFSDVHPRTFPFSVAPLYLHLHVR